jgi:cyclopropane fatty-acyl-phospholipid synthase-like methyltransferase
VLSIEMFEHMKNYEFLLKKVSGWLRSGGKLFVHIFCHKTDPYDMEEGTTRRLTRVDDRVDEYIFLYGGDVSVCGFIFVFSARFDD